MASLLNSIPQVPPTSGDLKALRVFTLEVFRLASNITDLFEKFYFGDDLDDSLYDLLTLTNSYLDPVLTGNLVKTESLASIYDRLHVFLCTLQQRIDCARGQ